MQIRRLGAWLAAIGALVLINASALAQDHAKDEPAPPKPATVGTAQPAPQSAAPSTAAKPQPAAKAQETAKPAPPAPPPRHVDTPKREADSLLGKEVYGADGAEMGLVTNVLVDRAGHPIAVVIDFGGFLGVGSRKIAVEWKLMHFHPGDSKKPVTLSLSKEQLKSAPEYKPEKSAAPVVQAPKPAPATAAAAKAAPAAKPAAPPAAKEPQEAKPATNPAPAPDRNNNPK